MDKCLYDLIAPFIDGTYHLGIHNISSTDSVGIYFSSVCEALWEGFGERADYDMHDLLGIGHYSYSPVAKFRILQFKRFQLSLFNNGQRTTNIAIYNHELLEDPSPLELYLN